MLHEDMQRSLHLDPFGAVMQHSGMLRPHQLVYVLRRESNTSDGKCSIPPDFVFLIRFHLVYGFCISALCDPAYTVHQVAMTLRTTGGTFATAQERG